MADRLARERAPETSKCSYIHPSGAKCKMRTRDSSGLCSSHRKAPRVATDSVESKMKEIMQPGAYLYSHDRVALELVRNGARILAIGWTGWPDLLFELEGRIFAAEVKGISDRVRPYQRAVIEGLRRLDGTYVIRDGGTKHDADEASVSDVLGDICRHGRRAT